jgi:2-methylisocitrate lyase-like PEP mutase family enzyme
MTSALATRAGRFRDLNRAGRLLLPNAWDAASARVFEAAGFSAIGTTSAGIAYAQGYRDGEQLGRDAMVRAVAKIVNAVSVPVTADIEAGYGPTAADVADTIDAVLDVGAVGVNLEDADYSNGAARLCGVSQQCERLAAARSAADRRGVPLVINARTDTFLLEAGKRAGKGVEERIAITADRGVQYLKAGADVIFVPLLVDTAIVKRLASQLPGALSLMALPGAPAASELFAAGAARVSIGQMAMLATLGTLKKIAEELLRQGTWRSIERTFYGFSEAEQLFPQRPMAADTAAAEEIA